MGHTVKQSIHFIDAEQPPIDFYDLEDSTNVCFLCKNPIYSTYINSAQYGFNFYFSICKCGIIKQTPMPNEKFFEWFFNSEEFLSSKGTKYNKIWGYHDYFKDEMNRLITSKLRYWLLKKYFPDEAGLNVMKIGPSTGTFLYVAKQHGQYVRGCDVSNRFRAFAQKEYGVKVDVGRFEKQGYDEGQFNRLLMFNVIENVPNLDEFMLSVQKSVEIGGYLFLNYVDMQNNFIADFQKENYSLFRPPVCYIFNRKVILKLLDNYGFKINQVYSDWRIMNLEKILTLFGWSTLWEALKFLHLHRMPIPIIAYPSRIVVAKREK